MKLCITLHFVVHIKRCGKAHVKVSLCDIVFRLFPSLFYVSSSPFCPPAFSGRLMTSIFFRGGQISRCFALRGAFGSHLTAPETCQSRHTIRSLLPNQCCNSRKSSQLWQISLKPWRCPPSLKVQPAASPRLSVRNMRFGDRAMSSLAIHYSLSASPPVIAVITWMREGLWRLMCADSGYSGRERVAEWGPSALWWLCFENCLYYKSIKRTNS